MGLPLSLYGVKLIVFKKEEKNYIKEKYQRKKVKGEKKLTWEGEV